MENRKRIQISLDYIEQQLRAELGVEELAELAGYSVSHYSHLFRKATGMSVGHYILRRRLLHAGYAISQGNSGIDTALAFGFDTYAGLYRAFVREFGSTPTEYLQSGRGKKPWRVELITEEPIMTHKEAARVLRHWNLEPEHLGDVLVESTGAQRENLVQVGENYFLKRTNDQTKLENSLALSKALAERGILSPVPVPTTAGEEFYTEGEYRYTLTERLPGRSVTAPELLEQENARGEGIAIAGLHRVLAELDDVMEEEDLLHTLKDWAVPAAREALGLSREWCEAYLAELEGLWPELPRQIIHRDLCPGNLIRNGEMWGFLDFELSQRNIRIYDVVYAAGAVLSEIFHDHRQRWLDSWKGLMEGYAPTEAERKAAPLVLLGSQLVCVAWFAGKEKHRELFETNRQMTLWILEHIKELR